MIGRPKTTIDMMHITTQCTLAPNKKKITFAIVFAIPTALTIRAVNRQASRVRRLRQRINL